jgi:hypothetical protein
MHIFFFSIIEKVAFLYNGIHIDESKQNQIAILVKNDVSWLELFRLNNWFDNTAVLNSNINKRKYYQVKSFFLMF